MINDQQTKLEIAQDWRVVRALCNKRYTRMLPGFGMIAESPHNDYYNLPLVLAYAVLDQVLNKLRDQGVFACKDKRLGPKMVASKNALQWQDYTLVDNGRDARNDLAHETKLASKVDCFRFIDAVESELKAWGII